MALAEAIKHTIFLCQLLNDKKGNDMDERENSVDIYMDNQKIIKKLKTHLHTSGVKTYRQKLLFIRRNTSY